MEHKLVLTVQTDEAAEWQCPACRRHIRLEFDGSGLKILNAGDQEVNHGSAATSSSLNLGGVSVVSQELH